MYSKKSNQRIRWTNRILMTFCCLCDTSKIDARYSKSNFLLKIHKEFYKKWRLFSEILCFLYAMKRLTLVIWIIPDPHTFCCITYREINVNKYKYTSDNTLQQLTNTKVFAWQKME
jgi:hypothetical protein